MSHHDQQHTPAEAQLTATIKEFTAPIFTIPGPAWIAIITAATYLVSQIWPGQAWAPAVVLALGTAAKLIQYWIDYKAGKNPSLAIEIPTLPQPAAAAEYVIRPSAGEVAYAYTLPQTDANATPLVTVKAKPEKTTKKIARFLFS